jgi:hypothetical protein
VLLIDNPTVLKVLSIEECIEVQERAFLGLATGASIPAAGRHVRPV